MAKDKKKKDKAAGSGKRKFLMIIMCLVSLVSAVLFKASFILVLLAILPTIVAYSVDSSNNKELYRCVMACNLAGALPQFIRIFANGPVTSFSTLGDMGMWLYVYSSAALGWIFIWCMPYFAEFITEMSNTTRIASLEASQRKLLEEWGPEIQRKP